MVKEVSRVLAHKRKAKSHQEGDVKVTEIFLAAYTSQKWLEKHETEAIENLTRGEQVPSKIPKEDDGQQTHRTEKNTESGNDGEVIEHLHTVPEAQSAYDQVQACVDKLVPNAQLSKGAENMRQLLDTWPDINLIDSQTVFAALKQGESAMEKLSELEQEMNQLLLEVRLSGCAMLMT